MSLALHAPLHGVVDRLAAHAVVLLDGDAHVTGWSPGAELLLGHESADMLGRALAFVAAEPDELARALERTAGEESARELLALRRGDGTVEEIPADLLALRDETGALEGYGAVLHAPRAADDADFRELVERAPVLLARLDLEGRYRYVSPACAEILARRPSELEGRRARDFLHPEDGERVGTLIEQLATGEREEASFEARDPRPDGSERWIAATLRPLRGAGGGPAGVLLVAADVTERHGIEARGTRLARRVRAAVTDAPVALALLVATAADALLVIEANTAFAELTGRPPAELVGQRLAWAIGEPAAAEVRDGFRAARLASDRTARRAACVVHPFAGRRWIELTVRASELEAGEPPHALLVGYDVTDPRRVAATAAASARELRRAHQELEQFAVTAAHDLAAPLRAISGFAELIAEHEAAGPEVRELVELIQGSAERMSAMAGALLDYARTGSADATRRPTSAQKALDAARASLAQDLAGAGAVVTSDTLPVVDADPVLLERLLLNLLSNAVRHRSAKPPRIHVSAERDPSGWTFSVSDNGPGVPERERESIFGFLARGRRRQAPGLGVGLAICRRVVERHGGRIWVEPNRARGSTFRFSIADRD